MSRMVTHPFRILAAAWALLLLLVSLAGAQPGPGNPPFNPTHYWTYHDSLPVYYPQAIRVQDQFYRQPIPIDVDKRERLLNWVHKSISAALPGSAVPDTFLHYTWWNIVNKKPTPRQVIVTNQFGSYIVQVHNLEFMLVPALKNPNAANFNPPYANHYLCYRAFGFPAPPVGYDLRDEWRFDFQYPQPMEYLCTPCWKEHLGQIFAPVDTVTHFAVYPIQPQSDSFTPFLLDQFWHGPTVVKQDPYEYLFVPSEKTDLPTAVKHRTWSRVKQLYR